MAWQYAPAALAWVTRTVAGRTAAGAAAGAAAGKAAHTAFAPAQNVPRRASRIMGNPLLRGHTEGQDTLTRLWTWQSGWDLFDKVFGKLNNNLPGFVHTITVGVQGGPHADLRRTYYLALAAAFGRWKNTAQGLAGSGKTLQAAIDVTGKSVVVSIAYTTLGAIAGIEGVLGSNLTPLEVIQRGPDQVTVGASWPTFLQTNLRGKDPFDAASPSPFVATDPPVPPGGIVGGTLVEVRVRAGTSASRIVRPTESAPVLSCPPGAVPTAPVRDGKLPNVFREVPTVEGTTTRIPWSAQTTGLPAESATLVTGGVANPLLPDQNRIITTGEKNHPLLQPPKPPVDGNSRGSLVALITQALSSPCYLPQEVPCNRKNPLFSAGITRTGTLYDHIPLNGGLMAELTDPETKTVLQLPANASAPDGYPLPFPVLPVVNK